MRSTRTNANLSDRGKERNVTVADFLFNRNLLFEGPKQVNIGDISFNDNIAFHDPLQMSFLSSLILGSSGEESDTSRGPSSNNYNIDVPVGLQVIPLGSAQESGRGDYSNGSDTVLESDRVG